MPKIDAPTLAEHRAKVLDGLVDAAERIMRDQGVDALTAGEVCAAVGIARGGLYRYVGSVDDLKGLVVARRLPAWTDAVAAALEGVEAPRDRLLTWVSANLARAKASGHGWLIGLSRSTLRDKVPHADLDGAHSALGETCAAAWRALAPEHARSLTQLTSAMVNAGFAQLDAGVPLAEVDHVTTGAVAAMIDRFAPGADEP